MQPATHGDVLLASRKTVETCTGIEAVLLFGSRVRQTYRPDSDWDVAILTRADPVVEGGTRFFGSLSQVNVKVFHPDAIEQYCNQPTRIEAAIARQAKLLAGNWSRPHYRGEPLHLSSEDFQTNLEDVTKRLSSAIGTLCHETQFGTTRSRTAAEHSWRAMEWLAKSVITTCGFVPASIHDMDVVALQIETVAIDRPSMEDRRNVATELRVLGAIGSYHTFLSEGLAETVARIRGTFRFQIQWLRWCLSHRKDLVEPVIALCTQINNTTHYYEKTWPAFEALPQDLQVAVRQWGSDAASIVATINNELGKDDEGSAAGGAIGKIRTGAVVVAVAILIAFLCVVFAIGQVRQL